MNTQLPIVSKNPIPGIRGFLKPMLLISIGAHLILLVFPTALDMGRNIESPKDQKSTKIRTIKIPPKTLRAIQPKPKAIARKTLIPPVVTPSPTPPLEESPSPVASPSPSASVSPTGSPPPSVSPSPSPSPANDPATAAFEALLGNFQSSLPATNQPTDSATGPDVLAEPEKFYKFPDQFYDGEEFQVGLPGLESNIWIPLMTPEEALPLFLQYIQANRATPSEAGQYGGGTVYKVQMGDYQRYLIVVPTLQKPIGTIIFIWNGPPTS